MKEGKETDSQGKGSLKKAEWMLDGHDVWASSRTTYSLQEILFFNFH
jgi:hypothetical protein